MVAEQNTFQFCDDAEKREREREREEKEKEKEKEKGWCGREGGGVGREIPVTSPLKSAHERCRLARRDRQDGCSAMLDGIISLQYVGMAQSHP